MNKMLKGAGICVLVVLLTFALFAGNVFAQQNELLDTNIQQTADYIYGLLEGNVSAYDGSSILDLIRAGKDCSGLAGELKAADWSGLTFAQTAINALAVQKAGGEAEFPVFTSETDLSSENPYTLCALLKALPADATELKQAIISALKAYYDAGSGNGFNYWGFSVDTNGVFIGALAPYADEDTEIASMITDALSYIDKVASDTGYGYDEQYFEANADSTAAALTAFAAAGDEAKAQDAYEKLMAFASSAEPGAFEYAGSPSAYATSDAFRGMLDYSEMVTNSPDPTEEPTSVPATSAPATPTPGATKVPNPETGFYFFTNGTAVYVAAIFACAVTVFMVRSRKKSTCQR